MKRSFTYLVCILSFWAAAANAEPPRPAHVVTPPEGMFLDDAFALRADGQALAYATTDTETKNALFVTLLNGAPPTTISPAPFVAAHIDWLDATRLVVFGEGRAAVWTIGKPLRMVGSGLDEAAATVVDGKPYVLVRRAKKITCAKAPKGCVPGDELQVRLLDPESLNEVSDARYLVDRNGAWTIGHHVVKPIAFENGFRVLVGKREGGYDKDKDIRLPESIVRVDLQRGKTVEERELTDPVQLATVTAERSVRPNLPRFPTWNGDHSALLFVDGVEVKPLLFDRNLALYDADSLQGGPLGESAWMAFKLDAYNPEAIEKRRRDPDDLEIYEIDGKAQKAERRLVLDGKGRSATVQVRGSRVAVLRRQKVVPRGGIAIELYDLVPLAQASRPDPAHPAQ